MLYSRIDKYNFIIDDFVIVLFMIKYARKKVAFHDERLTKLQNFLFKDKIIFETLYNMKLDVFMQEYHSITTDERFLSFFKKAFENNLFKIIKEETILNLENVKKDISLEIDNVETHLESIMNVKLDKKIDIYILPFSLGVSFELNKSIFYGLIYRYPHIVTLYHEILHVYFDSTDLSHAIIELLTNGEILKYVFNVNDENIYYDGHWFLSDIKMEILSEWELFIKKSSIYDNIFIFINEIQKQLIQKGYFYLVCPSENSSFKYLNLSPRVVFISGYKNGLIVDDISKDIIHIEKTTKDILNKYCYSKRPFKLEILSYEIKQDIDILLKKNIISIDNYKYNNIPIEDFRYDTINISSLVFDITNNCNYFCKHCYFYMREKKSYSKKNNVFDFELFKKILGQLRIYGVESVHIVGGEPLLVGKKTILKFIKEMYTKNYIKNIFLFTNASKLNDSYIKDLIPFREKLIIGITIHSNDEKENDDIAGVSGDFNRKKSIINLLKKYNIRYIIFCVYSKYNIDKINKISHFLENIKPITQLKSTASLARIGDFNGEIMKKSKKIANFIYDPFKTLQKMVIGIPEILLSRNKHPCFSQHIAINNQYEIFACSELHMADTYIGHLQDFNYSIQNLITSNNFKNKISMSNSEEKCTICEFRYTCFHCYAMCKQMHLYHLNTLCRYDPKKGTMIPIKDILN